MTTLRERLVGAWRLVSYREVPVDGSEPSINGQTIAIDGASHAAS